MGCRCENEVLTGAVKKGSDVKIETYNEDPSFNYATVAGVFQRRIPCPNMEKLGHFLSSNWR